MNKNDVANHVFVGLNFILGKQIINSKYIPLPM